jgi:hypothetical protein
MDKSKKHILLLNSEDKSSGTNNDCIFHLNESELHECHYVSLKDIFLTNTIYNIDATNNDLSYDTGGVVKSITVPPAQYSATTLLAQLNSLQGDLTFFDNSVEKKYIVSSTTPSFIIVSSPLAKVIGFTIQQGSSTGYIGDRAYNLIRTKYLHVISSKLAEYDALISSKNKKYAVIASIPMNIPYGFILNQSAEKDTADFSKHNANLNLSTIDIRWVDDNFNDIDFNGSDWAISFNVWRK